jgi:uncharacterized membrane protein YidH (DUF202 family)
MKEIDEIKECETESSIVAKITMLLAAKRTSLAVLRTGIAILTLPFSVVTVLIATSGHYEFTENMLFIIPLMGLNTVLVVLSFYLIFRSMRRILYQDKLIQRLKDMDEHLVKSPDMADQGNLDELTDEAL